MTRFRIEYLTETTDEHSVCRVVDPSAATLEDAGEAAFAGFSDAHGRVGASGFQIRDMSTERAIIVALETIEPAV